MAEFVTLDVADGVGTITLQRPPMNALNTQLQQEFADAARRADADASVGAVVVYGGPKVFAAGADVKQMAEWDYATADLLSRELHAAFAAVEAISKPTIAAVTGYALGGGLELALCCDLRVAGDNAKLGLPEILLGIIPGAGGTQRLTRLVGPSRAKDLILTGRFVAAPEALSMGLIDRMVPPDDVYAQAAALASRLAKGAPLAQRAAKRAVAAALEGDVKAGLEAERAEFAALFGTQDQKVGMRSFIENGPGKAEFSGR